MSPYPTVVTVAAVHHTASKNVFIFASSFELISSKSLSTSYVDAERGNDVAQINLGLMY